MNCSGMHLLRMRQLVESNFSQHNQLFIITPSKTFETLLTNLEVAFLKVAKMAENCQACKGYFTLK